MDRIEIVETDITRLKTDAIVNSANAALCGGGGVDGAIHRAAGKELVEECKKHKGCKVGSAVLTKGYLLPAKYVIHAVGPVWFGGHKNEEALLASCYKKSLELAVENGVETIAFPAISCGAYRFPLSKACNIAVKEVSLFLSQHESIRNVFFVCRDGKVKKELTKQLAKSRTA
ncbi:MAG: O-acetyl-ADP-ribose deacetylase [bacterium]|nr:O-acetyl-ADP-ribose deacetylase [bacterium]